MMYSWSYFLVYANERTCAVLRVNQIEKPYAINALIEKPYRINNAPYSRTLLELDSRALSFNQCNRVESTRPTVHSVSKFSDTV